MCNDAHPSSNLFLAAGARTAAAALAITLRAVPGTTVLALAFLATFLRNSSRHGESPSALSLHVAAAHGVKKISSRASRWIGVAHNCSNRCNDDI